MANNGSCSCDADGFNQDIDECTDPSQYPCIEVGHCHNKKGTFECSCPSGFQGDGRVDGNGCTRNTLAKLIHKLLVRILVGNFHSFVHNKLL